MIRLDRCPRGISALGGTGHFRLRQLGGATGGQLPTRWPGDYEVTSSSSSVYCGLVDPEWLITNSPIFSEFPKKFDSFCPLSCLTLFHMGRVFRLQNPCSCLISPRYQGKLFRTTSQVISHHAGTIGGRDEVCCPWCREARLIERIGRVWFCQVCARTWPA